MAWMIDFLGPSFAYKDYVYFLGQLERARQRGEGRIEVSFDRVTFFYPDGMAPFVAMINHLVAQGISIGVGEPATRDLLDYWATVGWLDHLQGTTGTVHRGRSYLPLTAYRAADELNSFINDALDLLAQSQAFPQGVLTGFEWSINEIADNVLVHADSDEPGWLQMTSYPETQKVEFVVVDTGRGIRASLSESHPDLKSDEQAVATAIEKGTTRDRSVGQGNGLSGTIRIASGASGFVNIHSGRGQIRLLEQNVYRDSVAPHEGTLVTVTLPTGAEINVSEALWGHVPVPAFEPKYVTDHGVRFVVGKEASNFGNRHTGERLRNKLANLATLHYDEPVIVDFDGVDLMSASFADEFIAKLVKEHGSVRFFGRFRFLNLSEFAATTLDQVIAQRLRE